MENCCKNCIFWDNARGDEWGACLLSHPDNDVVLMRGVVIDDMHETLVETREDFGCNEFDAYTDANR